MKRMLSLVFLITLTACSQGADDMEPSGGHPEGQLGTVHFATSCSEGAQAQIERGVALLHHMTYEEAQESFQAAVDTDPDCAMGYWGQAMTFIHPLWSDVPDENQLTEGLDLVNQAKLRGVKTAREKAYIAALEAYYRDGTRRDKRARLLSFDEAWREVYEQYPQDLEAAAFYALAHMATALPEDKSYQGQKESAEIAERVLTQVPDHPGAHHYIVHAYDYPGLANRALPVARNYGKLAPEIPHALHMPSHIFTRLGLWRESIDWNTRSASAALKRPVNGAISKHYFHALDYLVYAYLQRAEDERAVSILTDLQALEGPFQLSSATAYCLAAVPARYALERHQWSMAAQLEPRQPLHVPWDRFPEYESITHFSRALGAARIGDLETAELAIEQLAELQDQTHRTSSNEYWVGQVEIQHNSAVAWLRFAQGNTPQALKMMRAAAEMEAATHKHPVTPGEVLPARELFGDLLLELEQPKAALIQYELSLKRSPGRLNSLYGAGRAAELAGDTQKAGSYYQQLMELAADAAPGRERLTHAQTYLERH